MKNGGKIYIGSDHAGFELKNAVYMFLKEKGYAIEDVGPKRYSKNDDYPDYAEKVCKKVMGTANRGILICGSGQGMERTANKFPGIYASVCWNDESARIAKEHGNINVLCLAGRITKPSMAKRIVSIWLRNDFSTEKRHARRINKTKAIERRYMRIRS